MVKKNNQRKVNKVNKCIQASATYDYCSGKIYCNTKTSKLYKIVFINSPKPKQLPSYSLELACEPKTDLVQPVLVVRAQIVLNMAKDVHHKQVKTVKQEKFLTFESSVNRPVSFTITPCNFLFFDDQKYLESIKCLTSSE